MRKLKKYATFVLATAALCGAATTAAAQPDAPLVRRLSMDDAVRLALEQNLGIAVERFNPQIEDMSIAQARSFWLPTLSSTLEGVKQDNPATSALAGGQTAITDNRFNTNVGMSQILPFGTSYSLAWNGARSTTTNVFTNYNPLLNSYVSFNLTQPLLRNRSVDQYRQQLDISRKQRDASDVSLNATVITTVRNVKNAYWDLAYTRENLRAQQQALDLASGRSPTTRSAYRSARWPRSTSSRHSRKWRATTRRSLSPSPISSRLRTGCARSCSIRTLRTSGQRCSNRPT